MKSSEEIVKTMNTVNNKYILIIFSLFLFLNLHSQESQIIRLNPEEIEAIFLEQNLELIAEKMNISLADAAIAQAKLWDNPSLTLGSFNLWSTKSQRNGEDEVIPPLFGSFARNTQFTVELEQLIQTAGKRRKLVNMEKASKEISIAEFEETLRGLKVELRKSISDLLYIESYRNVLVTQMDALGKLIETYKRQVEQSNIGKGELLRLQAALFEIENELYELKTELNSKQKELKTLLNANTNTTIEVTDSGKLTIVLGNFPLSLLEEMAINSRPDIKKQELQMKYFDKSLSFEKAQRIPDVTVGATYDRWSDVWPNYIGFSIGIGLPVFNRNQGNIRAARINREQSEVLYKKQQALVRNEVEEAYHNYIHASDLYSKMNSNTLINELDSMLDIYAKNLLNKNVSMLEYIDFMETYKGTKQTWLTARKNLSQQFDELQFVVGSNLRN